MDKSKFFVSASPQARDVTLGDGTIAQCHFLEMSAADYRRVSFAEKSEDAEVRVNALGDLIAKCLCNEDGTQAITKEDAMRLKADVSASMFAAILDVSGLGKKTV